MRIIFLGNPEFARYQLEAILNAGFEVVAVVSAPDKPAGRGMRSTATPVTTYARSKGIPCLQPKNLKSPEFLDELRSFKADIQVVIAFRMLPEVVWDMPPLGTVNLHASLLPDYRGAAPINWAIIQGETRTGVTTFKLKHEIDTGDLLVQKECAITPDDTAGTLHDKLMVLGADAMVETLRLIEHGNDNGSPQLEFDPSKTAPKIFPETTQIDWQGSGNKIIDFIRGLSPYPVAKTHLNNMNLKVYGAKWISSDKSRPGEIISDHKSYLAFGCNDGYILITDAQLQGKKRMPIADLLNGLRLDNDKIKDKLME